MGTSGRGKTHNMLCLYRLNKFRILSIVNMCAEGDGINGDFSWNGVAFEASELFRFSHDVLDVQPKRILSSEIGERITRFGQG